MTQALPQHVIQTLLAGAENQKIADEAAEWFENPRKAYNAFFNRCIKNRRMMSGVN